ncbi:MAG: GMP synthase-like glutamine amidotransferase [Cellvibrionaceae bacterium]|jgi:GMP synthase-like glutamine amidotransferase
MKIGLLNACTPAEEIEFQTLEYDNFRNFVDLAPNQIELHDYRITEDDFPADPAECDGYIITGSPVGAYDTLPWIPKLMQFIRNTHAAGIKMVGICFGHQILAHALGGEAKKSEKGWGMGLREFTLETDDRPDWLTLPADSGECNLYFCHQDQVVQLPKNAKRLAGSEFCPNAMFTLDDQILGMQGHPEFTKQTMDVTVDYFTGKVDDDFIQDVAASYQSDTNPDDTVAAQWIVSFLSG